MAEKMRKRYPGAQPFTDDELSRRLFHGRERESTALTHQILANRLVVLFARSGLGKTSLLNAGVAENLRAEGFLPLMVRVNDISSGPLESVYRGLPPACLRQGVEYQEGNKFSLWHFFKTAEFWQGDLLLNPVLILDQFEELFTLYSEEKRSMFLDQFSHLVRGVRPKESPPLGADGTTSWIELSDSPPPVKIVVSLREDFLAYLEELSDRLPEILDQRFRLLPLARSAASRAMEEPAAIEDTFLSTRPFNLDSQAREVILDFLERRASSPTRRSLPYVEPFQLQLICQRVEEFAEKKQREGTHGVVKVTLQEIGGRSRLRRILKEFYTRQVAAVPFFQRRSVRRLCTEFLISPHGRRLRMEESEIDRLVGVKPATLRTLVDLRLLRADQIAEATYYELSHDSLIRPVLDSRKLIFIVRALLLLVLVLVGVAGSLWLAYIITQGFVDLVSKAEKRPGVAIMGLGFLLLLLWFLGRWARRNFREFREVWRRSRIEEEKVGHTEATLSFTYAIIGIFFLGLILGPIAIYKGIKALKIIRNERGSEGKGKALAGIILGCIETLLYALIILSLSGIIEKSVF